MTLRASARPRPSRPAGRATHRAASGDRVLNERRVVTDWSAASVARHPAVVPSSTARAATVGAQHASTPKPAGRNGLVALPRHAAQNEAEETVVQFKPNPLGRNNNQGS